MIHLIRNFDNGIVENSPDNSLLHQLLHSAAARPDRMEHDGLIARVFQDLNRFHRALSCDPDGGHGYQSPVPSFELLVYTDHPANGAGSVG